MTTRCKVKWSNPVTGVIEQCVNNSRSHGLCQAHRTRELKGQPLGPLRAYVQMDEDHVSTGRECTVCGEFKRWDGFAKDSRGANGRKSICRECYKIRQLDI